MLADLPRCRRDCLGRVDQSPAWATAAESLWGSCGQYVLVDGSVAAYSLVAPSWHAGEVIGWRPAERALSWNAVPHRTTTILVALWTDPAYGGSNLERFLVEGIVAEHVSLGDTALDAQGSRFRPSCLTPSVRVLQQCGFEVLADHPITPLMRLRFDRTVRVDDHEGIWRRLAKAVRRPDAPPAPAQRQPGALRAERQR